MKFNVVYCVRIPAVDDRMGWLRENERKERRTQRRQRKRSRIESIIFGVAFACCVHSPFLVVLDDLRKRAKKLFMYTYIISLHCLELILTARITIDRSFFPSRSLSPQLYQNCLHSYCAHGQNLFKI